MTTATTTTPPSDKKKLTKVTVNLVPRAVDALNAAAEQTGDSRTDTVNRALQMYALLVRDTADGAEVWLAWPPRGFWARLFAARRIAHVRFDRKQGEPSA